MNNNTEVAMKFLKFIGVGGVATLCQYCLLVVFVEFASLALLVSTMLSYSLSALLNYWLNYHFTFNSDRAHAQALPRFVLVALVGLLINTLVFALFSLVFNFYYLLAQVAATLFALIWNFGANKLWTFNRDEKVKLS